jgi:tRNA(Arg) A34 adenosine deaminase TadA
LIVDLGSGKILSEGWNKTSINPTFHGEIDAINQLVLSNPGIDGSKLVLYTTAEPCPMCQGAILWSGIENGRLWHVHSLSSINGMATD